MEVLNPDDSSSVLNTVLNANNNNLTDECLEDAVRLLKARPIGKSKAESPPDWQIES